MLVLVLSILHVAVKKLKHKIVEKLKDSTADTLGITRAVLVNGKQHSINKITSFIILDKLLKKLEHLESTSKVYKGKTELRLLFPFL